MARWPWQSKRLRVRPATSVGHQQRRHAVGRRLHRSGAAEDHHGIGLVRRGDRCLLAVEDVLVADALDAQAQVGRIRAAARLRQRDREQRLAAGELGEPGLHHLGPPVLRQDLAVQRRQQVDVGDAQIGASDLLVDDARRQAAGALAAELLRQLGRDEAHLAHLAHQAALQHAGLVAFEKAGGDAVGGEAPRVVGERDEVFVEIGVHALSP